MRSGHRATSASTPRATTYVDLVEAGIIDPTKVVRVALENAVSVASVLLLTEATLTEVPEPKKGAAAEPLGLVARSLRPAELRAVCDPATLRFRSTAELPPLDGMIGQERALAATSFGVAMRRAGYNLFVLGPSAHRQGDDHAPRARSTRRRAEPTPSDWCYVHNFADPYRPTGARASGGARP